MLLQIFFVSALVAAGWSHFANASSFPMLPRSTGELIRLIETEENPEILDDWLFAHFADLSQLDATLLEAGQMEALSWNKRLPPALSSHFIDRALQRVRAAAPPAALRAHMALALVALLEQGVSSESFTAIAGKYYAREEPRVPGQRLGQIDWENLLNFAIDFYVLQNIPESEGGTLYTKGTWPTELQPMLVDRARALDRLVPVLVATNTAFESYRILGQGVAHLSHPVARLIERRGAPIGPVIFWRRAPEPALPSGDETLRQSTIRNLKWIAAQVLTDRGGLPACEVRLDRP